MLRLLRKFCRGGLKEKSIAQVGKASYLLRLRKGSSLAAQRTARAKWSTCAKYKAKALEEECRKGIESRKARKARKSRKSRKSWERSNWYCITLIGSE